MIHVTYMPVPHQHWDGAAHGLYTGTLHIFHIEGEKLKKQVYLYGEKQKAAYFHFGIIYSVLY